MKTTNSNPNFSLARNPVGQLQLTDNDGNIFEGVMPVRAFPISAPEAGLSIVDRQGHELAWIANLTDLPAETRALIEAELKQREFMPVILSIHKVSSFATPSTWDVMTDKGRTQLVLKAEDQIWRLKNNGILITDKNGVNFMINAVEQLDKQSRSLLDRFL